MQLKVGSIYEDTQSDIYSCCWVLSCKGGDSYDVLRVNEEYFGDQATWLVVQEVWSDNNFLNFVVPGLTELTGGDEEDEMKAITVKAMREKVDRLHDSKDDIQRNINIWSSLIHSLTSEF